MADISLNDPHWRFAIASHIHWVCREAVEDALPELADDFPGKLPWHISARLAGGTLMIHWSETESNRTNVAGDFDDATYSDLVNAIGELRGFEQLFVAPTLAHCFSWRSLLLVLDGSTSVIRTEDIDDYLLPWLNGPALERAEDLNRRRVERALPSPPRYDLDAIRNACWVLESEVAGVQGTAFALEGVGFVTCAHVAADRAGRPHVDLVAFRTDEPATRIRTVGVVASVALDLATFRLDGGSASPLSRANGEELPLLSHIAVCGFPNHRPGDTCTLSPGVVTAHRMKSGVRRLLTNAGIVTGMSGGPAVGADGTVIGICANGADYVQDAREVEDQAIIPIAALDLLEQRQV